MVDARGWTGWSLHVEANWISQREICKFDQATLPTGTSDKTTLKLPGILLRLPNQLVPCQLDMIDDPNKST
jgi:hypothetical protein